MGTYKCSEKLAAKKMLDHAEWFLTVLKPGIDEPAMRLNITLSRITRPGQITMDWSITNVIYSLKRQVTLQSYRLEDSSTPLDVSLHVNSTYDTNGTALYVIDPSKDKGKNRYAKLEFRYLGGYNVSIQRGPVQMIYEDLKVIRLEHTEQLDKVTLKWSVTGMYENEKPTYSVSVFGESKNVELERKTDQTTIDIEIRKRPWRFHVEVLPLSGSYTGIKKEEEIYIAERGLSSIS
ncbi:unnamed protein product [Cylicocyclus nassatus]|uniref:Uncharacterized protein n=1 Tax=Cylicocyclus nassatus TaxID=53992 RepID=A0AA36GPF7_CYLNA|nr:unnamed protein product [Cylicocyclus nassatus]